MYSAISTPPGNPTRPLAHEESLDASDEFRPFDSLSYCPRELLATFTLLMSSHGRSVSVDMMLGGREYAQWQLARACTLSDEPLRLVAARLFSYFESRPAALRA